MRVLVEKRLGVSPLMASLFAALTLLTACTVAVERTANESTPAAQSTVTSTVSGSGGQATDSGDRTGSPELREADATPTLSAGETDSSPPDTEAAPVPDITGDLFLSIETPAEPDVIVQTLVMGISGHTTLNAFVTVNDEVLDVDANGRFWTEVPLEEGPNIIEVVVSDEAGNQKDAVLTVIREPA